MFLCLKEERSERKASRRSLQLAHVPWRPEIPISFRYLRIVTADSEYISLRQSETVTAASRPGIQKYAELIARHCACPRSNSQAAKHQV